MHALYVKSNAVEATLTPVMELGRLGFSVQCDVTRHADVASVFSKIGMLNHDSVGLATATMEVLC